MAKPGVSERGKIDSFIVMDLMRDAAAKQRELEVSGSAQQVLHLEVGQPSTGAPSPVKEAAVQAVQGDKLGYTEAFGIRPLRERLAKHYKHRYSVDVSSDDIAITTGSSGAFVVVFTAAFDPGDRVAMASPGYPCYRNILGSLGVEVVQMPVCNDTNWQPTVAMLEDLIKDGKPLKGLIIASPSNPTGTILSPEDFKGICDFCARNSVRLISDEIYHGITIDGQNTCSLTYNQDSIVINSFSKYFSMTGWRLGWVVCKDAEFKKGLEALLQNLFISAPTLSQQAGIAAFDSEDELQAHVLRYKTNAKVLSAGLPLAGFKDISRPQGAFYLYCNVEELIALWGAADSMALCRLILAQCAVACTPGLDFDPVRGGKYIRFSFAGATADMEEACVRLQEWYKGKAV
mmetsp:Transcript_35611/g.52271  ORF Transcript_35611/g.52271 Transcript_35611/m.52271 type:complete len:403 (+) Transcript_35611:57-1265(+)